MIKHIVFIVFLLFAIVCPGSGQIISQDVEFQEIYPGFDEYEYLTQAPDGDYIIALETRKSDQSGLMVGNTLLPAYHFFPYDPGLGLTDFFLCKMSRDYEIEKSFTIDNAEVIRDVFAGSEFTLVSMNLHEVSPDPDSFPILINGMVEIPRENNHDMGVVVVLDNNLGYQKFLFPSTGEIGNVAVNGHIAYFELRIPDNYPYIIVNESDTIHNQAFSNNPLHFGRQTVVLCSYNLLTDEVLWTLRLGNVGYEILDEMLIDNEGDLVVLGETSSTYFSFNDKDTTLNMSDHNPFIGKYSPTGEFLFGQLNPLDNNVNAWDLFIDSDNSIYWIGFYRGDAYETPDTMLIRPGLDRPFANQSILTKCSFDGNNNWVMQLEGDFEQSEFLSVTEFDLNRLVMVGDFDTGTALIGDSTYFDDEDKGDYYNIILTLNKTTGKIQEHAAAKIVKRPLYFTTILGNSDNQLDIFMYFQGSDTLFQQPFQSFNNKISGWLLKLSTDFLSTIIIPDKFEKLDVFPNPCRRGDFITVVRKEIWNGNNQSLQIVDAMGNVVLSGVPFKDSFATIPINGIQPGMYWIVDEKRNIIIGKISVVY